MKERTLVADSGVFFFYDLYTVDEIFVEQFNINFVIGFLFDGNV